MRRTFAVALLALTAPAAHAQDMGWSTITPSIAGTDTLGLALRGDFGGDGARPGGSPSTSTPSRDDRAAATPTTAAPPDAKALVYQPSLTRRRANLDAFIRKTRARNAAAGGDLARVFGSQDVLAAFEPELASYGMRLDNLADALALYWIVAWQTAQGHNDDFSRAKAMAVKAQTARALGSMRSITGAGDSAKQEFAEALWVQALLLDAAVRKSKDDAKMLEMLAGVARSGAQGMGIDLATMKLTETGFVAG